MIAAKVEVLSCVFRIFNSQEFANRHYRVAAFAMPVFKVFDFE